MEAHSRWITGLQFIGLGWFMAASILGGTFGGLYLDKWLDTKPVFLLLGVLLGVILAFFGTYRMSIRYLAGGLEHEEGKYD